MKTSIICILIVVGVLSINTFLTYVGSVDQLNLSEGSNDTLLSSGSISLISGKDLSALSPSRTLLKADRDSKVRTDNRNLDQNFDLLFDCEEQWQRFESNIQEVVSEMDDDADFEKVFHELSFYRCNESYYSVREEAFERALSECALGKFNGFKLYLMAQDLRPRHRIQQMDLFLLSLRAARASKSMRSEVFNLVLENALKFVQELMQYPLDFGEIMIASAIFGEVGDMLRPDLKISASLLRMVIELGTISRENDPINIVTSNAGALGVDAIPEDLDELPQRTKEKLANSCATELSARVHYQIQISEMMQHFSALMFSK